MKTIFKLTAFLCGVVLITSFSCSKNEDITRLNQVDAKVFKVVKILDENNQPKDYAWVLSTNSNYFDSLDTPIDDNILVPTNLLEEFKIPNLKVMVSGKKNNKANHALTIPESRVGFGFSFEITSITKIK